MAQHAQRDAWLRERLRAVHQARHAGVNNDRTPVEIMSRRGDAVLISRADYDALEETAHLLRSPANAQRLLESLAQAHHGERQEHELER